MATDKKRKLSILDRLVKLTVKPPPIEEEIWSNSPVQIYVYQLPEGFFETVDGVPLEAGYYAVPYFYQSPYIADQPEELPHHSHHHDYYQAKQTYAQSQSKPDNNKVSSKKARFNLKFHKHSHDYEPIV
ncbi:unnamed protein product [Rotaria sordida]|uniref:Uncharacterized protein n=1 Tax=Rotaria sordida TaxID=392033 RepID=A0A815Z590_9BILA|nr:unnamed protein product [Rotaria sordida]CAF1425686.1 unnamed protein product [Rotaria sordida]CAF1578321.1 unnamed protein product [Rotaria sordida]CAF4023626.1 unnamed protein product [Rotaria sordida]